MARQVTYAFKGKRKTIQFSYNQFHDMYEAVADAEGIDLKSFFAMEKQLAMRVAAVRELQKISA